MLQVGQVFETRRTLSQEDFNEFARLSGDDNPIHVDPAFAAKTHFGRTVSHGMLLYSLLGAAIEEHIPGARQLTHSMMFPTGTPAGETVTLRLEVLSVEGEQVRLGVASVRPNGDAGLQGETRVQLAEVQQ
ncbi:MaoC/PaaZ C-terminal domain-containing protein [Alkalilimnicola sp. S0819]|uniref:MaoC/PaaZ C-terminal domain-containing protein n=1 Tax=Alkalilimnicola sp. S0819 TaxID=2613922 RepID=UPI001262A746|nr:MaoC/PaaZ C-terminal domain-containing protein [Alkalilimnicola sp. S0819]KAB7619578.1 dehydratase [Alkalilimnicola sp. S0819]MPQ17631.1 dehydratase [Alkalilimnicola sp. S0819]